MRHFIIISALGLSLATAALAQETAAPATEAPATEAPAADAPAADAPAVDAPAEDAPAEDAPVPADDLSLGKPAADGPGSTYTAAQHGDWEQRCVRTKDGSDPCQLYQLLKDGTGNPVAELSVFGLPPGQQAAAGATAIVPLETLLTQELTFQVDAGDARRYPYSWCSPIGCIARIGFTAEEVAAMKGGVKATMTLVPVVAPDQKVVLEVSLKGFTAGYDAVNAANAANAADAPKAP
jgi:invasion protein IalB